MTNEPGVPTPVDRLAAIDVSPPRGELGYGRRPGGRIFTVGVSLLALGLIAIAHGGVALIALGALLCAPRAYALIVASGLRSEDRAAAAACCARLASGGVPPAVEPLALRAEGLDLDQGEVCYLDGAPVEVLSYYGDPYVKQSIFGVFLGGPVAWVATMTTWLLVHERNKRRAKKAKPHWRDPEPAKLWITSQRLMLHGLAGGRSWVQLRYEHIVQADAESGGLVLSLVEGPRPLMKISLAHPTSMCVLVDRLIDNDPGASSSRAEQRAEATDPHARPVVIS
jgi:hypothetical protein